MKKRIFLANFPPIKSMLQNNYSINCGFRNALLLLALVSSSPIFSQDKKLKKANKAYEKFDYVRAINLYEGIAANGYSSSELYEKLGNAYYFTAEPEKAVDWYERLMNSEANLQADDYYRYAQSLKSKKNYTEANEILTKLNERFPEDIRGNLFIANPNYLEQIQKDAAKNEVSLASFNSKYADFAPIIHNERLYFTSARDTGFLAKNIQSWNHKEFTDLYEVTLDEQRTEKLSKNINSRYNESTAFFTENGQKVYFTRNNSIDKKLLKGKDNVNRLQIYEATIDASGEWTDIQKLPFNSDNYSVAHPALNQNESLMVFASDMPGGKGKSDLYLVKINPDGSFLEPVNLGDQINTESRETFPFFSKEGVLYFSSDGHPGMGGLDLFAAKLDSDFNVVAIKNLGAGINSIDDDFSISVSEDGKSGYFASNREGGMGNDDIYRFTKNCVNFVSGNVVNRKGEAIEGAKIATVVDNQLTTVYTDTAGNYEIANYVPCGTSVEITLEKEGYVTTTEIVNIEENKKASFILELEDLHEHIAFNEIYFSFDRSVIKSTAKTELNKVVQFLNENPKYSLEIASFTDSIGDENYNLGLSQRRADSTVKYIISQGIDANRVSGVGRGEAQLANDCFDNVPCDKTDKKLNRRSEFKLIKE
ncbi:OmpA family protein [Galbibacter sp. BG1]|uniref:OmpA family protein n=1 Tax=Galbibacter sp. BG1 TaxID=1170699 RepID=UPI0015BCCFDE|nr:OmpA family protein [Galbibacter sp. BG1]QLE01070.1 OmpA family protein [Galbibacter sp. BG1]